LFFYANPNGEMKTSLEASDSVNKVQFKVLQVLPLLVVHSVVSMCGVVVVGDVVG